MNWLVHSAESVATTVEVVGSLALISAVLARWLPGKMTPLLLFK
jgi:hypothetical protein